MRNKKNNKKKGGYTIIETMIAVSLFIVIVTIGMGSLLSANSVHNKSQNMRSIIDNLSFVMEDMSRNLRTGYDYQCFTSDNIILSPATLSIPRSCSDPTKPGWALAFEYHNGNSSDYTDQWVYYIENGKIFRSTDGLLSNSIQLTPDEVVIDTANSSFTVTGAESTDTLQPFVTIKLVGSITYKDVVSPFSLQTSVSQRKLDF